MTSFTPGPWRYLEDHDGDAACLPLTICDSASNDLASIYSRGDATVDIPREQAIANARLIAAAPDLLEALRHAHEALAWHHGLAFEMDGMTVDARIEAALAATKGGAS